MDYKINTTEKYHREEIQTLGWELTLCNSLYPENTVLRSILIENKSFGKLLYKHLSKFIQIDMLNRVVEIGGGYGYLMKDFLELSCHIKPTMVDISPFLIEKQKETLKGYNVVFVESDFLDIDENFLKGFDLAIMNENLGDFPTIVDLKKDIFSPSFQKEDPLLEKIKHLFEKYGFPLPKEDAFNFNLGAIEAVEKICKAGVPYIYIGEHSCEAYPPDDLKPFIHNTSTENPEKISLMGHNEYTVKFSYLKKIGEFYCYKIIRGVFADFIPIRFDAGIRYILATKGRSDDNAEIICQFIEDLFKYEYLIFIRPR